MRRKHLLARQTTPSQYSDVHQALFYYFGAGLGCPRAWPKQPPRRALGSSVRPVACCCCARRRRMSSSAGGQLFAVPCSAGSFCQDSGRSQVQQPRPATMSRVWLLARCCAGPPSRAPGAGGMAPCDGVQMWSPVGNEAASLLLPVGRPMQTNHSACASGREAGAAGPRNSVYGVTCPAD